MSREEKLKQPIHQKDWSHLSLEQKKEVEALIKNHSKVFIVDKTELGLIKQAPAHIQVQDPTPCRSPIYRYPAKAKDAITSILQDLEERVHREVHRVVVSDSDS